MLKGEDFNIYYFKIIKYVKNQEVKSAKRPLIIYKVKSANSSMITSQKIMQ